MDQFERMEFVVTAPQLFTLAETENSGNNEGAEDNSYSILAHGEPETGAICGAVRNELRGLGEYPCSLAL